MLNCSISYDEIIKAAKAGHSAFTRSLKNKKVYINVTVWINPEPDQYDNDASIMLNSTKEKREAEGKCYIGNGRFYDPNRPVKENEIKVPQDDDLPF